MVAIKDMEMPSCCAECDLFRDTGDYGMYCKNTYKEIPRGLYDKERYKDCPLVEIITCKDCKHRTESTCLKHGIFAYDSFYCKEGERRASNDL